MPEAQPIKIDDLHAEMKRLAELLVETNDQARAFELEAQIRTLEIAKEAAILDPLTDINQVTAMDLGQLGAAIDSARQEIANIERRNEAIGRAMQLIRGGLKAAGLGFG